MPSKRRSPGQELLRSGEQLLVAAVSLGPSPDGKRRRRKVFGRTKTELRQKLRTLHGADRSVDKVPRRW
jgi:hypothetical protein